MKDLIRTGDFAKLAKVNKKTLMYYDELGLFQPVYVNEKGYRFYSVYQLDRFALITVLKDLGMELKEIQTYLTSKDTQYLNQVLIQKENDIDTKIQQLLQAKQLLQNYSKNIDIQKYINEECSIEYLDRSYYEVFFSRDYNIKGGFIINYITDGPNTGTILEDQRWVFYRKVEKGTHFFEQGTYFILYGTKKIDESSLIIKERVLNKCEELHLEIEGELHIEFNDLLLGEVEYDYYKAIIKIKDQ